MNMNMYPIIVISFVIIGMVLLGLLDELSSHTNGTVQAQSTTLTTTDVWSGITACMNNNYPALHNGYGSGAGTGYWSWNWNESFVQKIGNACNKPRTWDAYGSDICVIYYACGGN